MVQHPKLSAAAREILETAATHNDHFALLPNRLPVGAKRLVVQSLLKPGLIEEIAADDDQPAWRTAEDGTRYGLRATPAGLHAVGSVAVGTPSAAAAVVAQKASHVPKPTILGQNVLTQPATAQTTIMLLRRPVRREALRIAAEAILSAWDDSAEGRPGLTGAVADLRAALAHQTSPMAMPTGPGQPRPDTKRAAVLSLLRRPEGATVAHVVEATGWARNTVHGFFAGLKKSGTAITVLDRIRQVGPGQQGAAGIDPRHAMRLVRKQRCQSCPLRVAQPEPPRHHPLRPAGQGESHRHASLQDRYGSGA